MPGPSSNQTDRGIIGLYYSLQSQKKMRLALKSTTKILKEKANSRGICENNITLYLGKNVQYWRLADLFIHQSNMSMNALQISSDKINIYFCN